MADLTELEIFREAQAAEFRAYLDAQCADLLARLTDQQRQSFERNVARLERMFRVIAEEARRRFIRNMEKSKDIRSPVLREANEEFLRKSLAQHLDSQKKLLAEFAQAWGYWEGR